MSDLLRLVESHGDSLLIALILSTALLMIVTLLLMARVMALSSRLKVLLTGKSGHDLEEIIQRTLDETLETRERIARLNLSVGKIEETQQKCLQKVGLVRYDAFNDVRGRQSFSVALLDAQNNGAVLTALLGRNDSRLYGKPVMDGKSEHALSEEEAEALRIALNGGVRSRDL